MAVVTMPVALLRSIMTTAKCAGLRNHLLFILLWHYLYPMQPLNPSFRGTSASIDEGLLSSGRPEDRKKVHIHFLPHCRERDRHAGRDSRNAPWAPPTMIYFLFAMSVFNSAADISREQGKAKEWLRAWVARDDTNKGAAAAEQGKLPQ
ncbi:hypothetical protein Taro_054932 [Colocasia esculenta]|uniref:Uncharacterized protein n=1 Tax=Colocasia esculenta TaxID=4460 RepID=A0A843XRG6_COLES|nr:hypothetical protein [Colocasia esculenta]